MARPGGPKRGAGANPYERKSRCECDRPIPQREVGGMSCVKCGLMIHGTLEPSAFEGLARESAPPAVGRTHRTSGSAIRI